MLTRRKFASRQLAAEVRQVAGPNAILNSSCSRVMAACVATLVSAMQSSADTIKVVQPTDHLDAPLPSLFRDPPEEAKPRTWWHWMNGNVTREGITADLEWMKRAGIGGFQLFDATVGTPQFIDSRVGYMTPQWQALLRHAAHEADRLGLEMGIAASPGFSETGGPWVAPKAAMKKLVWSEMVVGPGKVLQLLPRPPSVNGRFQDIPQSSEDVLKVPTPHIPGAKDTAAAAPTVPLQEFYADAVVIAVRNPDEAPPASTAAVISSDAGHVDGPALTDLDVSTTISLRFEPGVNSRFIRFDFQQPFTATTLTIAEAVGPYSSGLTAGVIEVSADGNAWTYVATIDPRSVVAGTSPQRTYSFPAVVGRAFRVTLSAPKSGLLEQWLDTPAKHAVGLSTLRFGNAARVNRWEEKAQFGSMIISDLWPTPAADPTSIMLSNDVIDLTSHLRADGRLDWTAPAGTWSIIRFGYSLTGATNHPAQPEGMGYEVDKLSASHVEDYLDTYLRQLRQAVGPYFGQTLNHLVMDSWEAGLENWTDNFLAEFKVRRGYDAIRYLPVLTGRVIDSAEVSERFLWDYRRTIADLLAANHYRLATRYAAQHGFGVYAEAMGVGGPTTGDGLQNKGAVTIPMAEFWTTSSGGAIAAPYIADVREAVSATHIYGKQLTAAEAFTTLPTSIAPDLPAWGQSPFDLKPIADRAFALGVNRMVLHTSVHQPFVDEAHKPGLTMGGFGQHFTRNMTWAEQAGAWNGYLARCSYMLQRGQAVADILYYYGEGAPATVPFWKPTVPAAPAGYSYDWVDANALLTRVSAKHGRVVLPDGMSYGVLVLPEGVDHITYAVLRKLRELVAAGVTLVAPRPIASPSLADQLSHEGAMRGMVAELWGSIDGKVVTSHRFGKGIMHWGPTLGDLLKSKNIAADFEYTSTQGDPKLAWTHRRSGAIDIYFISNQENRRLDLSASFRVSGVAAELWYPDRGKIEPTSYRLDSARESVPLKLDPYGSVFVVFRRPTADSFELPVIPTRQRVLPFNGPWEVHFPKHWGAPPLVQFTELVSWSDHPDAGVKYFSGTATYTSEFTIPTIAEGARYLIDLGEVKSLAEISVNGYPVGEVFWKPPFRADVTSLVHAGSNSLAVAVTNLWPNRMIGDQQPGNARRFTFTDFIPFTKDSPLLRSGLLGPVSLIETTQP